MNLRKLTIMLSFLAAFSAVKSQNCNFAGINFSNKCETLIKFSKEASLSPNLQSDNSFLFKKYTQQLKKEHQKDLMKILGLSSSLTILIILSMWLFYRNRGRKIKNSYYLALETLADRPRPSVVKKNTDSVVSNNPEIHNISRDRINISEDTEKKLLKKLAAFEASEKFLKKDLTLTSMAGQKGTNPKYLSKIIHTHKRLSFTAYINKLRMNYIIQKLYDEPKYRGYKISYLAEECGYTSAQVFVVVFKKETGVTPSSFINQLRMESAFNPTLIT